MPEEITSRTESLRPTEANTWRSARKEGFVVELPSGNHCRVRRTLDMFDMVKSGRVPNKLIAIVQQMMGSKKMSELDLSPEMLDGDTLQQMTAFIDIRATRVMIEPRCMMPPETEVDPSVWDPPEGAISVYDLTQEDKLFLFHIAQGGVADLEKFREEQKESLAALQDVAKVQAEAEQHAGVSGG